MSSPAVGAAPEPSKQYSAASALGLAFVLISPVIALFSIMHLMIMTDGPRSIFALLIVLGFQFVVAFSLAELASKWPVEGGGYQWVIRLIGPRAGWIAGWLYLCAMVIAAGSLATSSVSFFEIVFDTTLDRGQSLLFSAVFVIAATAVNIAGPRFMKLAVAVSLGVEFVASVVVSLVLLAFFRVQPLSVLGDGLGLGGSFLVGGSFLSVVAIAGWAFVGFESATDLAEEVRAPRKALPIAIVGSLLGIGVLVLLSFVAIALAVPDYGELVNGNQDDVVSYVLASHLGEWAPRAFYVLILLSFFAGVVTLVAGASRVTWSFARDGKLPRSDWTVRLRGRRKVPVHAMVVVGVATFIVAVSSLQDQFYALMVGYVTFGFFLILWNAMLARMVRLIRRHPLDLSGSFSLGRFSAPASIFAFCWLTFALVNVAWPRDIGAPWYVEWMVLIAFGVLAAVGALIGYRYRDQHVMPDAAEHDNHHRATELALSHT